jgi:hypothetical protein
MKDTTQSARHTAAAATSPKTQESTVTASLAQQFAAEYATGVIPAMLKAIKTVKRNVKLVAAGAIIVSTPHQALYLASLGHGDIAAWVFAIVIPLVFDLGMLTMLTVTQTAGMASRAKRRAMVVLAVMVTISAAVNAIAPGPMVLRVLFGTVAAILAALEWVNSAIAPDFAALEQRENEVAAVVEQPKPAARRCEPGCTCGKHTARKAKPAAKKPRTRKPAAPKVPANAPVSPAPGGAMVGGLWLPAGVTV